MIYRYFEFTKKRILVFGVLLALLFGLQFILVGSLLARQKVVTEAGNSASAVIGILDKTEVVRQKFKFRRNVVLSEFSLSFGSYERKEVGDMLNIQVTDGDNNILYEKAVSVDELSPNSSYLVEMEHTITIPRGAVCCIKLSCSSKRSAYDTIPTLNTTNKTEPNTYLSTLKMQTGKKSLNISYTYYYRQLLPFFLMLLELALVFVLCFGRVTKNGEVTWKRILVIVLNPLILMFFVELLHDVLLTKSVFVWLFTWILLLAVEGFLYALFGEMSVSMIGMDVILFFAGMANLVLLQIRGTPFLPGDLFALGTAAEVSGTYRITLTPMQFVVIPAFLLWCVFLFRMRKPKQEGKDKRVLWLLGKRLTPAVTSVFVIGLLYQTQILSSFRIADNVWNKVASCRTNGFFMNFFLNLHYLSVSKPSGYSEEKVEQILEEFQKEEKTIPEKKTRVEKETGETFLTNADFSTVKTLEGKKPNIILIMNESLADYALFAKPNYNQDPLKFMHSLTENTIYGKDFVSVYGAGTSNSEFEAMTGNSMKFFPSGSNVYQQFMHEDTLSLPSYLKGMGYSTIAIHPSSGENWNRIQTYQSMKFDRFITIEDFENPEYVRYISDKESYKKVIEVYETKEKGTPLYCFDMTIQNHGGYLTNTNWKDPVYVKGSYYQEAKEFLSATKVSDDAFRYLVEYFEKQEEPTIICMFGDHQPSIEIEFYEEIMEKSETDWNLQDIQKRYMTPFILWANYDISEGKNVILSNNYLENLLLKQAGIDLPLYQQFIEKVSGAIPAMNVNGYMDDFGVWHHYDTAEQPENVTELLTSYELLQYAYYSDTNREKMKTLFQQK